MQIKCPHCNKVFDASEALNQEIENASKNKLKEQMEINNKRLLEAEKALQEKYALEAKKISDERIKMMKDLQEQNEEKIRLETENKFKKEVHAKEEQIHKLKLLQDQANAEQLKKLKEAKDLLDNEKSKNEIEKARLKAQLEESMKKLQEKPSQELQGEVQEFILQSMLENWFTNDIITEIKKGQNGADVKQEVTNFNGETLGTIIYESKNTKSFEEKWILKLKEDQRSANADIAILVTKELPIEMKKAKENFATKDDSLFICTMDSLKIVATLVRKLIVETEKHKHISNDITNQKEIIWKKVNSPKFAATIEAMNKYFNALKEGLEAHQKHNDKFYRDQLNRIEGIVDGIGEVESIISVHKFLENKE